MIGGVVLCVGDSLTHGARDEYGLSYPRVLSRILSKKYGQYWVCVEKGINGEKSSETLRRFYDLVRGYPEAAEVVLWIGTNDAKKPALPPEVYEENLWEFVRTARFCGKPIHICTLPMRKGFGAPDFVDNEAIRAYNEKIVKVVFEADHPLVWCVDLRELPEEMKCDGIHLKHGGNVWVAERVAEAIERRRS